MQLQLCAIKVKFKIQCMQNILQNESVGPFRGRTNQIQQICICCCIELFLQGVCWRHAVAVCVCATVVLCVLYLPSV